MSLNLIKLASLLKNKKIAQRVLDLGKRLKQKEEQEELLEKTKGDLRLEEIFRQHEKNKPSLRFPEGRTESFLPGEEIKPYKGRWELHLQYPSFDEKGRPYFDQSSVSDFVTVAEDQIKELEKEEKMGYLKILSRRLLLPKSRLK